MMRFGMVIFAEYNNVSQRRFSRSVFDRNEVVHIEQVCRNNLASSVRTLRAMALQGGIAKCC
jgi:hypothetical protein